MAINVIQNKKGGSAVVLSVANTTIQLSDLVTGNTEVVVAMSITKIFFSTQNVITISCNGGNNVVNLSGTDHWTLDYFNILLCQANTANIVITIPDAKSTVILELSKQSTWISDYVGATSTS